MQIKINLKQIGKRRNAVKEEFYTISDDLQTVRELLVDLVTRQVQAFNAKVGTGQVIDYLTKQDIKDNGDVGKIGFGELANDKKQDLEKAIDNALQSFEDGIYCIFIGEEQKENLSDRIELTEDSSVTFVRLTMLAGRMW
ncbi:hypothetical protein EII17_10295 [Clostridiales bacterium COT073_COT-073]|nr:hypothetical protein EII17_10295 [Clostridiales bacterium COT073_COT-073]